MRESIWNLVAFNVP